MSIGYLVTTTLVVICTAVALVPLRRPRSLGLLSFSLGQVVNELPHLVAAFLLASTALEVVEGNIDLGSPGGVALAGVLGLVLLAHVELARRSLAAPTVLTDALREGLGSAALETSRPRRHTLRWLIGFVPFRPWSVVRVPNRRYGPHRLHRLDVYHHRSRPQGARVLVYLHGGGYFSGGKHREARALLHRLAGRGWVCLSADYRLRPEADFVDHVTDAKRVIAWARQHASAWGGDPRTLVISGSSAGGHLATLAALTPGDPVFQEGFEGTDTSVSAAIGLYGYYGSYYGRGPGVGPASTPLAYDAEHAPPVLMVSGANDTYVGTDAADALAAHLRTSSDRPVVHAVLPGAQHAFDVFRSLRFEAVVDAVEIFLDRTLPEPVDRVEHVAARSTGAIPGGAMGRR